MFGYTRKARSAQIHCVFLTVVLLQLLLCANDIERNPGPDPDMETLLQRLFTQQEVKFQTLVSNSKGDFSHWKTNSVQKWTVRLVLSRTKCKFSRPNSKIRRKLLRHVSGGSDKLGFDGSRRETFTDHDNAEIFIYFYFFIF